jgi:hypothetical protein
MANSYKNIKTDYTTTTLITLLTVDTGSTCIIKSMLVSEDAGSTPTITISLVNGSDTFNLFKDKPFTAKQTIEFLSQPLVLQGGEILKAQASAGDQLHSIISYLEVS